MDPWTTRVAGIQNISPSFQIISDNANKSVFFVGIYVRQLLQPITDFPKEVVSPLRFFLDLGVRL